MISLGGVVWARHFIFQGHLGYPTRVGGLENRQFALYDTHRASARKIWRTRKGQPRFANELAVEEQEAMLTTLARRDTIMPQRKMSDKNSKAPWNFSVLV
mmetsp:Transcript_7553/g.15368  ORF Transcript_7553/g.15368 Transcript_7553/m.15368 type:complete len:100 (-) Transcript_7553:189-488(-)